MTAQAESPKLSSAQGSRIPAEDLRDVLTLGLTWLREGQTVPDQRLARPGASVFRALTLAGVLFEGQRKQLYHHVALISLVMREAEILHVNRKPKRKEIMEKVRNSEKLFIILVIPAREQFQYHSLFGGGERAYQIILTDAGVAHAMTVADKYAHLIDAEKFAAGWAAWRAQCASAGARMHQNMASSAAIPTGMSSLSGDPDEISFTRGKIPQAPQHPFPEDDENW